MKKLISELIFFLQARLKSSYLKRNRSKLICENFTIISSNCWGGILYKDLGLRYETPFVNMYMYPGCFVKMMKRLDYYMDFDLRFVDASQYMPGVKINYPLAILNDVEIHFIHFKDQNEVILKWNERKKRINYSKIIAVMCERDGASPEVIEDFDKLSYPNKLFFCVHQYPSVGSAIKLPLFSFFKEAPPADQIAGFTYVETDIISYINRACG